MIALVLAQALACLVVVGALLVLVRENRRLELAAAQFAKQSERAEALAAFALVAVFPRLTDSERTQIPDRYYRAAVQAVALAEPSAGSPVVGEPHDPAGGAAFEDLTHSAQQLPPSLPG